MYFILIINNYFKDVRILDTKKIKKWKYKKSHNFCVTSNIAFYHLFLFFNINVFLRIFANKIFSIFLLIMKME